MIKRIFASEIVKESGMILFTIIFLLFAYGLVLTILNWALQYQWLFPFVTISFIGVLIYLGAQDLKSPEAKGYPVKKGLAIFTMMVLIAALGFGAISLWLATVGWAKYSPANLDLFSYNNYYMWLFFEMIPLLKVNDALGLVAPLQPVGVVAGLPVLIFRIIVLYVLLKGLKTWWTTRTDKNDNMEKSQSTMK
jgi:hypothetical protein